MSENSFDVVILGAGPAGYVCAIRCAQLGLATACVDPGEYEDQQKSLGGTCLNVGCIPSKALLDSTHHYSFMQHEAAAHGLVMKDMSMDIERMQARKRKLVKALTQGIAGLFKKNKVTVYFGKGSFTEQGRVEVAQSNGESILLSAKHYVIASGSMPAPLALAPVDQDSILDSSGVLALDSVPKHLGIIGAGVIGLEMGSVWSRLGSQVTILEAMSDFLPAVDRDIAKEAAKQLSAQGLEIRLDSKVKKVEKKKTLVHITYESAGEEQVIKVDKLLVSTGRKPSVDGLNLADAQVELDKRGFVKVDAGWRTSAKNIYAIGDVTGGAMLAHKASEEGIALAEKLAGQHGHVNYDVIPWVIYTWPEIAWAGKTEQQLQQEERKYRAGTFPFLALGRAHAAGDIHGMFKMLSDAQTDQLLGVHIIGPQASELIAEAVVALEAELSAEDLARTVHAHPTLSEGLHEAALAVDQRSIHY